MFGTLKCLSLGVDSTFESVIVSLSTFLIIKIAQSKPKIIILVGLKRIVRHNQILGYLLILFLFLVKPNILGWMLYLYFYRSHINIISVSPKFFELVLYAHWLNNRVEESGGHVFLLGDWYSKSDRREQFWDDYIVIYNSCVWGCIL